MRLVLLSDTHTKHNLVKVPDGDVLVHAGDSTYVGDPRELEDFNDWLGAQSHSHKVCIWGNHELTCDEKKGMKPEVDYCRGLITNATVLFNSETVIDGVKFWGSPYTPWFMDWAFNMPRGSTELKTVWDSIPEDTNVLIVHTPPLGVLDQARPFRGSDHLGCWDLAHTLGLLPFKEPRVKPAVTVFGHIHGSGGKVFEHDGRLFINASVLDEGYQFNNQPIVVDLLADGSVSVVKTDYLTTDEGEY